MEDFMLEQSAEQVVEPEMQEEMETRKERRWKWNPKAVFTKKHLVLASLIAVLGVAVYLNWAFTRTDVSVLETSAGSADGSAVHYGDVQQVDASASPAAYFEEARLNRSVARDKTLAQLEDLIANDDITSEDKKSAVEQATALAMDVAAENRIENLVLAKGFEACIAYINGESCSVVVQTDGLLAEEAAQIKDIILREYDLPVQNISIVEVN